MKIEDTRTTVEARSSRELNHYLSNGWVLLLSYVKQAQGTQEPRFVVGWQKAEEPVLPELLDESELREIRRYSER